MRSTSTKSADFDMEGIPPLATSKSLNTWVSVYELLRGRIIAGTYCPGEKLNEREIAQLGNVSRTPTREALRVLEYEGFVTNIVKGVFVKCHRRGGHYGC
jgi:DNA-binding GntR family transcriptional regulator